MGRVLVRLGTRPARLRVHVSSSSVVFEAPACLIAAWNLQELQVFTLRGSNRGGLKQFWPWGGVGGLAELPQT